MCGRYVSTRGPEDLAKAFQVTGGTPAETLPPSWNVAPTDTVWAVLERPRHKGGEGAERQLRQLRWGLVPFWAESEKAGAKLINARVETVHEKPAFRRAFAKRRCLLPADGFYEWKHLPATETAKPRRQPYFITAHDGQVMAMAGLYEFWRNPAVAGDDDPGAWWTTCTIITTDATDAAGRIHPRMPLTLTPDRYDTWLDPHHEDPGELRALLTTPADGHLDARPVSTAVNNVRTNGPDLVKEVPTG
ncbi:SOS response-associated peptidase [Streptomyces sp. 6N223]|uniref:SOS response-associated peptidase n=1 Tax=Streptomyces sp. 6N223 TaxID=3457412 RepID=UPI003FD0BE0B